MKPRTSAERVHRADRCAAGRRRLARDDAWRRRGRHGALQLTARRSHRPRRWRMVDTLGGTGATRISPTATITLSRYLPPPLPTERAKARRVRRPQLCSRRGAVGLCAPGMSAQFCMCRGSRGSSLSRGDVCVLPPVRISTHSGGPRDVKAVAGEVSCGQQGRPRFAEMLIHAPGSLHWVERLTDDLVGDPEFSVVRR